MDSKILILKLQCTDKCGLTQETRTAHCATQDGTTYPDEKCDPEKKPELKRDCETPQSCEFEWVAGQWSEVKYIKLLPIT